MTIKISILLKMQGIHPFPKRKATDVMQQTGHNSFIPLSSGLKPISVAITNPSLKAGVNRRIFEQKSYGIHTRTAHHEPQPNGWVNGWRTWTQALRSLPRSVDH